MTTKVAAKIDRVTKRWIRCEADERAAHAGYRFDEKRGQFTVDWMAQHLCLYEGDAAGQPFECFDWQLDCTMRMFGWCKMSERWKRKIRRFTAASIWVPKKNKKSPTLAAWSLYLFVGDGEPGQKVFLVAKDGRQAKMIAGKHAIEMVLSSDALMAECDIDKGECSITHRPTRSLLMPLSSANAATQEAKEGINGCLMVDETHVVDRDYMGRISRAGISRSEPFHIEVSTGGKNVDCYGKERQDYARLVQSGEKEDHSLFVAIYEIPLDLSEEEFAKAPAKWGKLANPAWGHTVGEEEFLHDYSQSSATIGTLADFFTYRCNRWQSAANPWIRKDDWAACRQTFAEADLRGQPCGAGLDLGKTDDMSSLSLVFPADAKAWNAALDEMRETFAPADPAVAATAESGDEGLAARQVKLGRLEQPVRVLSWYWLPEEAIAKYASKVPYREWVKSGHLRVTPGRTVEQDVICQDIAEILRAFAVSAFAYDPWYAALIVAALQKHEGFPEEAFYPFQQSLKNFAFPASLFEKLIISGKWNHNGNPITNWQAGHVTARSDNNGNLRPVKPPREDRKKIDGIVSGIMALDATTRIDLNVSAYASTGVMYLGDDEEPGDGDGWEDEYEG